MFTPLFRRKSVNMCFGSQISLLSTQRNVNKILTTHLKVDYNVIQKINKLKQNNISKISKENLIENCKTIRKMNINIEKIKYLEHCLELSPAIMKNRILVLKEMGARNLGLQDIYKFPVAMRKSIRVFKKVYGIPKTENIMKIIMNNIGLTIDEISANKFDYNVQTGAYYTMCMMYYKTFHLQLYDKAFYQDRKHRYQSFQELTELLNVLRTKYQFDCEFLSNHPYLLHQSKDNVERYLTEFKDVHFICNKSIIEVVRKYPRILCYPIDKVKELLSLCKKLDISAQSIIAYICTIRMKKEVFLSRYINILNNYELSIWSHHPRMLNLIYSYDTALSRAEYLKLSNRIATANIHTYLCKELVFMRYIRGDLCHHVYKKFLLYILCKELGKDKTYLIDNIIQHKYCKHVSLLFIVKTIEYLKKYYSIEDICQNIHIVLYSQSTVNETLKKVYAEFTPDKGYSFTSSQYLALCLYTLEKKHHFNGDAIWQGIEVQPSDIDPNVLCNMDEDEYENFIKSINTNNKAVYDLNEIAWFDYLLQK